MGLSAVLLICCSAALFFSPPAAAQSSITLRTFARVAEDQPVRLAHIAILDGPEAQTLADAVILPADDPRRRPGQWATLELADLRSALESRTDVPWAHVTLRGGRCSVGPAAPRPADHDGNNGDGNSGSVEAPFTADNADLTRVRGHVAVKLAQYFGVEPADLRIRFEEADSEFLATPTSGRVVQVRPLGTADRVPVRVTVFELQREQTLPSRVVRATVLLRREVAVSQAAKRRGEHFEPGQFTLERQWLSPTFDPANPQTLPGAAARARVSPGQPISRMDVEPPIVVRRGDMVQVHCVSGSVIVSMTARALSTARDGEVIELETLEPDRRNRRTFTARMDGPGRAVSVARGQEQTS